jgi:hypothetical protein
MTPTPEAAHTVLVCWSSYTRTTLHFGSPVTPATLVNNYHFPFFSSQMRCILRTFAFRKLLKKLSESHALVNLELSIAAVGTWNPGAISRVILEFAVS